MNAFAARVANWLANEVLVKHLVKNKSFQNMALRTHLKVERTKEAMKQTAEEVVEGVGKERIGGGFREKPVGGFKGFVRAFGKEVREDFGGGKGPG
ncbi:hypothetical protein TrVE_jg10293 [Triparma verrucosa]|uniref:Uncharacterized protein n=2 Tax=Triparma TaxID=722752 RepID=A0A9W7BSV4_9STRA|nr:hypothetical protein TrST_g13706 [Triparma strigata]GMH99273.1 hypothetical protein TrVE_jg10293 [Triparma verrucosa]